MSKKLMSVTVKGENKIWSFNIHEDPQFLIEWRADGLDIVEIENTIPEWVPGGFVNAWCFLQDIFNFKNPFKR